MLGSLVVEASACPVHLLVSCPNCLCFRWERHLDFSLLQVYTSRGPVSGVCVGTLRQRTILQNGKTANPRMMLPGRTEVDWKIENRTQGPVNWQIRGSTFENEHGEVQAARHVTI